MWMIVGFFFFRMKCVSVRGLSIVMLFVVLFREYI